jgi:hypothetical protein
LFYRDKEDITKRKNCQSRFRKAEFKDCSLADEIVSQIVRGGFGYFDEEKQEWWIFLDSIAEGSREILKETDRERAMATLVELIGTSQDEYTRRIVE